MPEILTESFCERCGTRYTFEAAAPSRARLGRLRVVSRGLRNYVLSDESSLEEAFAEARSDDERALTSQQLDAFHQTFNFCMSCRQYTCANCWNEVEARCLTCAPHLGHEVLPAPFPTLDPGAGVAATAALGANGQAPDESAWPAADLFPTPAAGPASAAIPGGPPGEALAASAALASAEPMPVQPPDAATDHRAAVAAAETAAFLSRFRPGESLDSVLAAYEEEATEAVTASAAAISEEAAEGEAPDAAALAAAAAAGAVVAADAAAVGEPAAPEEPVATPAVPEPTPAATEKPARLAAAAAAWQVVAPDDGAEPAQPALPTPPVPPPPSAPASTPAWPPLPPGTEAPQWPAAPLSPAALQVSRSTDLLWAESSRDVLSPPVPGQRAASAVQPCVSCGLALSATARFCRRCGSPQG